MHLCPISWQCGGDELVQVLKQCDWDSNPWSLVVLSNHWATTPHILLLITPGRNHYGKNDGLPKGLIISSATTACDVAHSLVYAWIVTFNPAFEYGLHIMPWSCALDCTSNHAITTFSTWHATRNFCKYICDGKTGLGQFLDSPAALTWDWWEKSIHETDLQMWQAI